jgi:Ycf66 protein N-terminus
MLTYLLAFAVALGSLALYFSAFLYPEIHRKGDLVWSGVGLFYALVLWVCAKQITGGVLLGQMAGSALLGWFAWQTINFRWQEMSPAQSLVEGFSLGDLKERANKGFTQENLTKATSELQSAVGGLSEKVKDVLNQSASAVKTSIPDKPLTPSDFGNPPVGNKPGIFDSLKSVATSGLNSAKNKAAYVRQTTQAKADDVSAQVADKVKDGATAVSEQASKVAVQAEKVADQAEEVAAQPAATTQKVADAMAAPANVAADEARSATEAVTQTVDTATAKAVEVVQDAADTATDHPQD